MTGADDIDGVAAEYVLGTLDATERAAVAARRQREPQLDAAIRSWERRLAPLNEAVPQVAAPLSTWQKIEARITGAPRAAGGSAEIIDLKRRLKVWRTSAIAASALAASLVLAIGVRDLTPVPKSKNLVAVLQKDAASPAFLVTVNIEDRLMTVQPVAAKKEAGKSHELWIIHDSLGAPKSLGIIDDAGAMQRPTLASYKRDVIEGATLAVSLEPEGGSPTGAPTGPVVFAGKMIETSN
jgi:anti-sigma-K factor RskA